MSKVICGDCLVIMSSFPPDSIDLVVTDPPYNKGKDETDKKCSDDFWAFNEAWLQAILRVLKSGHHCYFTCASNQIWQYYKVLNQVGYTVRHLLIWATNECRGHMNSQTWLRSYEPIFWVQKPGRSYGLFNNYPYNALDVQIIRSPHKHTKREPKLHICQKPLKLYATIVAKSSQEGDVVLDPFSGSGAVAVACTQLKREYIVIDISPKNVAIAKQRLKNQPRKLFEDLPSTSFNGVEAGT